MRILRKYDLAFGVFLIIISCYLFQETYHFREVAYFSIGPTAFPRTILGTIIVLSTMLCWQSLAHDKENKTKRSAEQRLLFDKNFCLQLMF